MSDTNYVKKKKNSLFKKVVIILGIVIMLILMLGIKNSSKIDHSMFITAIGIDKSPTDPNKILVTFQIVPPEVTSQSSSDVNKVFVTSINEYSIAEAIARIHNYMSHVVTLTHTRAIIFSEEIAKEGIGKYINDISSSRSFDTNMYILICKDQAQEYLESIAKDNEVNPVMYYNIIRNSQYITSASKSTTVMQFLKDWKDPCKQPSAPSCGLIKNDKSATLEKSSNEKSQTPSNPAQEVTEQTDNQSMKDPSKTDNTESSNPNDIQQKSNIKIAIGGMATFQDDKMVGYINADETAYHLMLTSTISNFYLNIGNEDEDIQNQTTSTNIYLWQQSKASVSVKTNTDSPFIDIIIPLNAYVNDTQDNSYDYYNDEYMKKIKEKIITKLEKNMKQYLDKLQNQLKVDITDFSKSIRKDFLTQKDLEEYNWNEQFLKAKFNVKFELKFVTSGLSTKK